MLQIKVKVCLCLFCLSALSTQCSYPGVYKIWMEMELESGCDSYLVQVNKNKKQVEHVRKVCVVLLLQQGVKSACGSGVLITGECTEC